MFCPNCRYEYNEGVLICPDCGANLVMELPPDVRKEKEKEADESKSVMVFENSDRSLLPIVKSILDENGIIYLVSSPFINRTASPVFQIIVNETEYDKAKELLNCLE